MKTLSRTAILILTIIGILSFLTTCKKETECGAVITVKLQNDTNVVVPNAIVKIHKEDIYVEGISDANGQYRHTFKLEAILDIDAKAAGAPPDTLYGQSVIRLKPGKTVYKSVFIN